MSQSQALVLLQTQCGITADGAFGPGTYKAGAQHFSLTNNRAAHFFAQTYHESGGFLVLSENLNYSEQGLLTTFPSHFNQSIAAAYARQPEKIANHVYANKNGNGDENSGDGWNFRGRGCIQLTGRSNYQAFANYSNRPDVMTNPDLLLGELAFTSALFFFERAGIWGIADQGTGVSIITEVTKRVNGGTLGLSDRIALTEKFAAWS